MERGVAKCSAPFSCLQIDKVRSRCYIDFIKCLPEQTGKELNSMMIREVVIS